MLHEVFALIKKATPLLDMTGSILCVDIMRSGGGALIPPILLRNFRIYTSQQIIIIHTRHTKIATNTLPILLKNRMEPIYKTHFLQHGFDLWLANNVYDNAQQGVIICWGSVLIMARGRM